ncbi:MAG: hypothetical protein H6738_01590 [Alphaproteobacteria bacterium]|nr:hypothetical protein [Alphaproteobacteria bacterium]MCB9695461.1 hypothetical protein [Alphaproteobacteria bacterium]
MVIALLLAGSAHAASVGVGLDLGTDLPDANASDASTAFPVGGALRVPIGIPLAETAGLRITPRFQGAQGQDLILFPGQGGVAFGDEVKAWYASAAVLVGPEVRITRGGVAPTFGAGVGPAVAMTFHNFDRCGYFAPNADCGGGGEALPAMDPSTTQFAVATELSFGVQFLPEDPGIGAWVELGYGSVGVPGTTFGDRAVEGLERAPYAYNAVRLGFGVLFGAAR